VALSADIARERADKERDEILFGVIRASTVRQGLLGLVGAVAGVLVTRHFDAGGRLHLPDELCQAARAQAPLHARRGELGHGQQHGYE